jgi:diaminopropionate ammonia-lyase
MMADKISRVNIVDETLMAGLSCGEVSQIVWPLLRKAVKHVLTIPDDGVIPMMNCLAKPDSKIRRSVEGGECSAASLIALMAASTDGQLRDQLKLNDDSSILILGTEGATDPEFYQQAVSGKL